MSMNASVLDVARSDPSFRQFYNSKGVPSGQKATPESIAVLEALYAEYAGQQQEATQQATQLLDSVATPTPVATPNADMGGSDFGAGDGFGLVPSGEPINPVVATAQQVADPTPAPAREQAPVDQQNLFRTFAETQIAPQIETWRDRRNAINNGNYRSVAAKQQDLKLVDDEIDEAITGLQLRNYWSPQAQGQYLEELKAGTNKVDAFTRSLNSVLQPQSANADGVVESTQRQVNPAKEAADLAKYITSVSEVNPELGARLRDQAEVRGAVSIYNSNLEDPAMFVKQVDMFGERAGVPVDKKDPLAQEEQEEYLNRNFNVFEETYLFGKKQGRPSPVVPISDSLTDIERQNRIVEAGDRNARAVFKTPDGKYDVRVLTRETAQDLITAMAEAELARNQSQEATNKNPSETDLMLRGAMELGSAGVQLGAKTLKNIDQKIISPSTILPKSLFEDALKLAGVSNERINSTTQKVHDIVSRSLAGNPQWILSSARGLLIDLGRASLDKESGDDEKPSE